MPFIDKADCGDLIICQSLLLLLHIPALSGGKVYKTLFKQGFFYKLVMRAFNSFKGEEKR